MPEWTMTKDKTAFIKGVAIIVVILGHCGLIECGGAIGVDLFLLISGYGIYFSYIKSDGKQYWRRRFISVYFPYLFCTICFIVFRFLTGTSMSWQQIVISLLGQDFDFNVDPTMWYISFIFVMYFLAWGYMKLSKKNRYLGILWGGVLVFMVTACGYKYLIWHKGTIAWAYGLTFPCGLFIAENKRSINKFIPYITGVLIITSIALLFVPHESFIKMIFPLVLSLSLFFIIGFLNIRKFYGVEELATKIGNYSFFMYLNEALIIGLISKNLKLVNLSLALCSIAASFCLAVIMYKLYQLIQRENKL